MSSGCPFAHDDGSYVLGALSPAERAAYERHLAGCATCRKAVAEIAVLPGLLGRLDPAGLGRVGESATTGARLPALIDAAAAVRRRERRTTHWRYAGTALTAACLALVVGLGPGWLGPNPVTRPTAAPTASDQVPLVAMRPVRGEVPVSAAVGLDGTSWGTEITMRCTYGTSTGYPKAYSFHLVAYGADGAREQVASWAAAAGDEIRLTGATRFAGADLVRLELTRYDGVALLAYDVP